MKLLKNILSIRKDLSYIFLLSISIILLIDFWLINIPEYFHGGKKIGELVYSICFSYISGFIFYFLVVHIKSQKDKKNLYGYISTKTLIIINQAKSLITVLKERTHVETNEKYPSSEELHCICLAIVPNSNAPITFVPNMNNGNWLQFIEYIKKMNCESIDRIQSKLQYLDSSFISLLAKIEDCGLFQIISQAVIMKPIGNSDLIAYKPQLSEYLNLIKELEAYYEKKLKDYK